MTATADYTRYTVEDENGEIGPVFEQHEYVDAKSYALKVRGKVIAQEYPWVDSEIVDDFTPTSDEDEDEEG